MSSEINPGTVEVALEISRRRRDTLVNLKKAIRARKWKESDKLITELVPDSGNEEQISRAHLVAFPRPALERSK